MEAVALLMMSDPYLGHSVYSIVYTEKIKNHGKNAVITEFHQASVGLP